MMPVILPAGTESLWGYYDKIDRTGEWEEFATDIFIDAFSEPDQGIKHDLIILAFVARERAHMAVPETPYPIA